jgi:hypothetical protein
MSRDQITRTDPNCVSRGIAQKATQKSLFMQIDPKYLSEPNLVGGETSQGLLAMTESSPIHLIRS